MSIRIGLCGTPWDYKDSVIPKIIELIAGEIIWEHPRKADLVIVGPFDCVLNKTKKNWTPKFLRSNDEKKTYLESLSVATIFHTSENVRPDKVKADYSISFDEMPHDPKNLRFPYWMEFIDWSEAGIKEQKNPRFGALLDQKTLLSPLRSNGSARESKAAFFTSHLHAPKKELYALAKKYITVDGFGPAFDSSIKNHAESGILKKEVLQSYQFNFCPENSMYPGYNTEKIPEAFAAGCVPITWTVPGYNLDFDQNAYINLADKNDLEDFKSLYIKKRHSLVERVMSTPLLKQRLSIDPCISFLEKIIKDI